MTYRREKSWVSSYPRCSGSLVTLRDDESSDAVDAVTAASEEEVSHRG